MEIPRLWREQPTNIKFEGWFKQEENDGIIYFKFPGGQIPMLGSLEQVSARLVKKGFNSESVIEILSLYSLRIASEASISTVETIESLHEEIWSKVWK